MFDLAQSISVSVDHHPINRAQWRNFETAVGSTVADIVRESGVQADIERFRTFPTVMLIRGAQVTPVPLSMWAKVRPTAGTRVEVAFPVGDPGTIALVAAAALPHAATATATALLGAAAAGTLAYTLTVAAVTIVGGLLINALIPPASQGKNGSGPQNYAITGLSNAINQYGAYPYVIGRHQLFPPMTATGYSETVGRDLYYRGRMTFGYGPVALETLNLGTTPIWEYEGVELEFLNVDEATTLANMPELANLVSGKSQETVEPKHRLGIGEDYFYYKPANAAKQVSITLAFGALWFYDSFNIAIDVSTDSGANWSVIQSYPTRSSGVTWTSAEFDDAVVRWYRMRVLSAVKSGDEEARRHGRQYSERPTVSKVVAKMQGTSPSWRYGAERMTLYSDDVTEDAYSDVPQQGVAIVKYTRDNTVAASLDLTFPQGLYRTDNDAEADRHKFNAEFQFEYQSTEGGVNEADWIDLGSTNYEAKVFTLYRVTKDFTFPEPGEYAIRITRLTYIDDQPGDYNSATLTAIRSISDREVPSHEHVAEVAFRIKATEQLNGQVDNLNAIVQQLAPVWNGSAWTDPQPVRHPAWQFARALMGPHLRRPVAEDRLLLNQLKAWADEEPHWTCDYVVDTDTQLNEVLDIICAAGQAKKTLLDFKWSVIRDQAQGAVRQVFTPRNSWGYSAKLTFPRKIDGFRTMVRSERLDWQKDEVLVLNDNVTAETAVELEELELPGVVVTADDLDEGNVYRLARYHLAVALNRVEEHSFHADWEAMRITRGDKILLIHDVPLMGVGQGRVAAITEDGSNNVASITLDNVLDLDSGVSVRLTVRTPAGLVEMTATSPSDVFSRVWTVSTTVAAADIALGDLAVLELTEQRRAEMLVTGIEYSDDESALIKCVDAVPDILDAATTIPTYNPVITNPRPAVQDPAPPKPVVDTAYSDERTQLIDSQWGVVPRAAVLLEPFTDRRLVAGARLQLRWREYDSAANWEYSQTVAASEYALLTGPLVEGLLYDIEVISIGPTGSTLGWVQAATQLVADSAAPDAPAIAATFTAASVKDDSGTDRRPAIHLAWVAPFRGAAVVAWRVRVKATPDIVMRGEVSDVQALEALISESILPNVTYECQASFVTAAGAYAWSAWQEVTTADIKLGVDDVTDTVVNGEWEVPGVPAGLTVTSEAGENGLASVVIEWGDVTPSTGYDLEVTQDAGTPSQWRFYTSRYEDLGVPGTGLQVRVRAVNGPEVSAWSDMVTHSVATDTIPPVAPTGVEVQAGFGSMWVSWDDNTEADMSHYEVAELTAAGVPTAGDIVASVTGNTFTATNLGHEETRFYYVRAVDTSGNTSPWSDGASDTTPVKEAVTTEDLQGIVDATSFADGIAGVEIFTSLPTTDNYEGRKVTLTTDGKLYTYHNGSWQTGVEAADIAGQIQDAQIAAMAANKVTGQLTDSQIADIDAAKLTGQLTNSQIASFDASKLTGTLDEARIASVAASKVTGTLTNDQIADLEAAKLTGQITGTQITDGAISTGKLAAGAVTTNELAANSVVAGKIATDAVTAAKIQAGAVETAKLAAGAVQTDKLDALAVTAAKLAAGAVEADKIAANAVVAGKIATDAVTAGTIAAGAVTTAKLAAGAVTADQIAANAVVAGKIAANAVTASTIAADAVTATHIAANAVAAEAIQADAILASKIVVSADTGNLVPNAALLDEHDSWAGASAGVTYTYNYNQVAPWELQGTVYMAGAGDAYGILNSDLFPVEPNGEYYASFMGRVDTTETGTTGSVYMQVQFYASRDLADFISNSVPTDHVYHGESVQKKDGVLYAPSTARYARIQLVKANNGATAAAIGSPVVRKKADANLIVDGSIVTAKLAAGAVKADQISAGAIVSSKLSLMDTDNLWSFGSWSDEDIHEIFEKSVPEGGIIYCHATVKASGNFGLILQKGSDLTTSCSCRTPNDGSQQGLMAPVRPGERYFAEVEARASAATTAGFYARIRWFDVDRQYLDYTNIAANVGLTGGWTRFAIQTDAPSGAMYAGFELYNHSTQTVASWFSVDHITLRKANAAELIVDGTIKSNHLVTDEAVITGTAQIANAVITTAKIGDLQITGAKIANATISSAKISDLEANKVTISGATKLSNWQGARDATLIRGGYIETNSIRASSLIVGNLSNMIRNGDLGEQTFSPDNYFRAINGSLAWDTSAVPWNNVVPLKFTKTSLAVQGAIYPFEINTAEYMPVDHNSAISYDLVVRAASGQAWNAGFYLVFDFYDGSKTNLGGNYQPFSNQPLTASWQRFQGTYWVPSGAAFMRVRILNHTTNTASTILYIAHMRIGVASKTVDIEDGAITADKITVNELSAVTATVGILRTATSGARMEIRNTQLLVYDSSNVLRVKIGQL